MTSNRLLILDDDPGVLTFLGEVGRGHRYEVALTESIDELQASYGTFDPSLIVLDLQYAHGDGIEVLSFLKQRGCRAPIVLISGFDERVLDTARRVGIEYGLAIVDALVKPIHPDTLGGVLEAHREPDVDEWAGELRAAIDHDHLTVYYQPKVQVADGRLVGFEALARWIHPTRGVIGPDHFIPLAETTRLIAPLTDHVLDRAVADRASWAVTGHDLTVAVNLSPLLLAHDRLLPDLLQRLAQYHLTPENLTLEVTESAAMQNPALTLGILGRLRLRGFNLALDDFGTGYSNLAILHRMPFNELKIDQTFVTDVNENRDSRVIVGALAGLARQLGLTTVAEGVENLETWAWLRSVGVEQIQGFGIARPMPADRVVDWIGAYTPPQIERLA
jgi:EAL domain-containing protein (putative c-di-GMP-specific phosphodiesterase class I)